MLLDPNPDTRLGAKGADEIKKHAWFKDINWKDIKKTEAPIIPERIETQKHNLKILNEIFEKPKDDETIDKKDGQKQNTEKFKFTNVNEIHNFNLIEYNKFNKSLQDIDNKQKELIQEIKKIKQQKRTVIIF